MSDSPPSSRQDPFLPPAVSAPLAALPPQSTFPLGMPSPVPRKAWVWRGIAVLAAVIAFLLLPSGLSLATRAIAAWDLFVLILVAEGWFVILRSDPESIRRHAAIDDPGRFALLAISVGASFISLGAALLTITRDESVVAGAPAWLRFALALAAIAGPWLLLHTAYTLHYAHLYFGDEDMIGGLAFRGGPPDGWDFAYFAFGVGMTFQVPDVEVTDRDMRRVVLRHQLISFLYNTAILALVVNLLAGHL